jgi:dihydrofolate synthase/folylpolyglutamate synthase
VGAPLARLGSDFTLHVRSRGAWGSRLRLEDGPLRAEVVLPLPGPVAPLNAALALAGVRRLLEPGPEPRLPEWAATGWARVSLPARIERLERDPLVLVDAAHTPASARALAQVLEALPGPVDLVLSISGDKDLAGLLATLLSRARRATLTRADAARSLDPVRIAELARSVAPELALSVVPNPHLAVRAAREALGPGETLCVTGSVYLAGIARKVLRDPASSRRVAVTRGGADAGGG